MVGTKNRKGKLSKQIALSVEEMLDRYPLMKQEISRLKELALLSEQGELPLEVKGYVAVSGAPIYRKPITDDEAVFLQKFLNNPDEMAEMFGVPCRNHVSNAEFCGAFYIHMSKCPQIEGNGCKDCPLFEVGIPIESHRFQRISEWWLYNFSDIEKEIVKYLHSGETPSPNLLLFASAAINSYETGDPRKYLRKSKSPKKTKQGRIPLPVSLRFKILSRDGFKCRYCGSSLEDGVKLHVDHVIPVSKGGTNDESNLVSACQDCNLGKSDHELQEGPDNGNHNIVS